MSTYTIRYFQTEVLRRTRDIECASDDDALEQLAYVHHPGALELWQADRLVWSFDRRLRLSQSPLPARAPASRRRRKTMLVRPLHG